MACALTRLSQIVSWQEPLASHMKKFTRANRRARLPTSVKNARGRRREFNVEHSGHCKTSGF
eukprot:7597160-Pyramimonas_sp.AAC.1